VKLWHLILFIVTWISAVLAYWLWPEDEITHPPGILVSEAPQQRSINTGKSWRHNGYWITALAELKLRARVLHKEKYRFGREADLSPIDLALGWGAMSDQEVLDQLEITQHSRWYYWRAKALPVSRKVITSSSANMHMIPVNDELEELLDTLKPGHIIEISGYLVAVRGDDGWTWRSSLTRTDVGNGACEIVWVESLSIK